MFTSYFTPSIFFKRSFQEHVGYSAKEKDGRLVLKINVVGLGKDDLDVNVKSVDNPNHALLIIEGEKKDDLDNLYKVNNRFYLYKMPKKITPAIENGILTLEIEFKEPVSPDVQISW